MKDGLPGVMPLSSAWKAFEVPLMPASGTAKQKLLLTDPMMRGLAPVKRPQASQRALAAPRSATTKFGKIFELAPTCTVSTALERALRVRP
jgi:hypothetical protein